MQAPGDEHCKGPGQYEKSYNIKNKSKIHPRSHSSGVSERMAVKRTEVVFLRRPQLLP